MKDLLHLTGDETNLSTTYRPQTDGQTEQINQEVEQYLCIFVNKRQTDWSDWLPSASFSYNDKTHSSTGYSPFCHELAISLLFFYLFLFFSLASALISPRVLTEPSTLLTLIHDTFFRWLIHPFRFYSALLHSEPFAIGWLSI